MVAYKFANHVFKLSRQDLSIIEHGRRRHRRGLMHLSVVRFARKQMVEGSPSM